MLTYFSFADVEGVMNDSLSCDYKKSNRKSKLMCLGKMSVGNIAALN